MALSFNTTQPKRDIASLKKNVGAKETTNTPAQSVSASDFIREEENNVNKIDKEKLLNYFKDRSNARTSIASGKISSGNKAQDVFETRVGKLVDLYLDASSREVDDNGNLVFTADKIIEASKNPSKVIKDMKNFYQSIAPDRAWAIDDYIQKGGMASNVFDYLEGVGGVDNPYGKAEVMGNVFDEKTPEAAKGVAAFGSFLPSRGTNIAGKILGNNWLQDKAYNLEHNIWDSANDEEYKLYKKGKAPEGVNDVNMFGQSKAKFYDDYTQAQKDGFVGNVDEYKDYKKKISQITNDAVSKRMKEGILTDEDIDSSATAIASDGLAELITYLSIPFTKSFKASQNPLVNEIANIVVDSLINTAELAGVEDLKGNPMTKGEVGFAEGVNLLVSGITRSPVIAKYISDLNKSKGVKKGFADWFASVPEKVRDAYDRLTAEQLKNIKKLSKKAATDSSIKAGNKGVRYFGQQGIDAAEKSLGDYLEAGAKLGREGQNLRDSGITKDLIESEMNKSLKNLENKDYMGNVKWGEGQAPQIHITETSAGPEIHITRKENLNMVKNGEKKGLGDAIEDIFYGMFKKGKSGEAGAGIELNEASMLAFMNEVKGATQGTEWSWGNMGAKAFGDGLDAFRTNANLPKSFTDAEKEFFNKRDLHNLISDSFGSYGKYSSDVDKISKQFTAGKKLQDKNLQGVLEQAQDAGYISDNIDAEIIAYGYMLALQDEAAARAFFDNIYPSKPGFIEALFESARNGIKEGTIDKYIASKEAKDLVSKGPGEMLDRIIEWREGYRTADKALGGAFNIMKNRINDYQDNKKNSSTNQRLFTDEEYADFINSLNYN